MILSNMFSKYISYPLWDIHDRSIKLQELKSLERRQWDPYAVKTIVQRNKLETMLVYCRRQCPYYKAMDVSDFRHWPVLTKDDIRNNADALRSREFKKADLISAKTGGSTGVSLEVFFDKRCQEMRNAAALMSNRWSGWDLGEPIGALWGNPVLPKTWKEKLRSALLDRMVFLDTINLNEQSMGEFINQLRRYRIHYLFGHAHSLAIFAHFAEANAMKPPAIKGIIATSMVLLEHDRNSIERAFRCKVTNRYGCEEVGLIASECEFHKGLHINTDHLFVELLNDDGRPAGIGEEGDIVVTDLINRGMPLVRYKVGDRGIRAPGTCLCGRGMPLLERVAGRSADFLVGKDGSLVAGVSLVERTLTAIPGIAQLQIVQENLDVIKLHVVPDKRYSPQSEELLAREMMRALGTSARPQIIKTKNLTQDRSGKYRFSICKIDSKYQAAGQRS